MISVQKKFFEKLEETAEQNDLQVVTHFEWSNTGTLHLQEKDSFDTWLSIPFRFNEDATFGWMGGSIYRDNPPIFTGRSNPWFAGFKPNELGELITYLVEYAVAQRDTFDASSIEADPMGAQRSGL